MGSTVLTNCRIWMGGYELSGQLNSIGIDYGAELLDDTVFGTGGTRSNKPGLKTLTINGGGFWDDELDGAIYARIGADREVVSVSPTGFTEGDRVYFTRAVNGSYNPLSGAVGELLSFELDFHNSDCQLVRGVILGTGQKTVSGVGAAFNLGPVLPLHLCYGALHVKDPVGTGGTLDVVIESSPDNTFAAAQTRLTFPQVTDTIGGSWDEQVGPIADTWWRAKWTITGAGALYPLHISFGIL